jgi:hypothetical protein
MAFSRSSYAFSALVLLSLLASGCGRSNPSYVVAPQADAPAKTSTSEDAYAVIAQLHKSESTAPAPQPAPAAAEVKSAPKAEPKFDAKGVSVDLTEIDGFEGVSDADFAKWQSVKVVRGKGLLTKGALETFAKIPQLKEFLWTEASIVSDAADQFAAVVQKSGVAKIRLQGLRVANQADRVFPTFALAALAQSPSLVDLDVSGPALDVAAEFAKVDLTKSFPKLEKLNLYQTNAGDAGVDAILPLADRLTWLNLDDAGISPESASKIAQFKNLTFLHVGRSTLDDASVLQFAALTKLEKIHITRSLATEEGADALRKALPNCVVVSQLEN